MNHKVYLRRVEQGVCVDCGKVPIHANRRCKEHYQRRLDYKNNQTLSLKLEVIQAYGGKCAICGDARVQVLEIDHVREDGKEHRKHVNNSVYRWLRNLGFPQDGRFQVLCGNCNKIKSASNNPKAKALLNMLNTKNYSKLTGRGRTR